MSRIRTLIADDEPLGRQGVAAMLRDDPEIEVVSTCADGRSARDAIVELRPDLAFLDVEMPVMSGMAVLRDMPPAARPTTIFVTAYTHYALQAFDAAAVDYLVKPFREARFREALAKAKSQLERRTPEDVERRVAALLDRMQPARISFKVGRTRLLLSPADIVWIEASGDGVKVCEGGQVHLVRETLSDVERRLDGARFQRVHRSYLVNLERIRKISALTYGEHELVMSDGVRIRLGRAFREKLSGLMPSEPKR